MRQLGCRLSLTHRPGRLEKIDNFDIFRPKMDSTKEVLHAIATFAADCPPLWEEKYREKREKLQPYLESFGWRALDAE
jgi:hypothetical protein